MRVLMLGWELPPNNSGGLGVACLQLSKALAKAGADIDFILPYFHEPKYEFMRVTSALKEGMRATVMPGSYQSFKYILEDGSSIGFDMHDHQAAYTSLVGKIAERMEFDIIHAHDWLTFRAALLAKQKRDVPLVLHVHSVERDRAGGQSGNPLVREIEQTSLLLADQIYTVSRRTKQMIVEDYDVPAEKIEVVHNSLDISDIEPLDDDNSYRYLEDLQKDGWKVVTSVGRLTIQKGLPHLMQSAKEVISRLPKTIFLFVGDGEQRDELIELAASYGISANVIFAGFQRGKRWRDAYAISDLFVMPSVSEPFGLTPFEAAAYGSPSLISRQSGVAEVFSNCLKVDYWDVLQMSDKIISVLNNQSLQTELAQNAYQEFTSLSWDAAAGKIMQGYRRHKEKAGVWANQ